MTKTLSAFFVLLFVSGMLKAQNTGGDVDDQRLHFGFTFQYIAAEYKIYKNADWREPFYLPDEPANSNYTLPLYSISSPVTPGFGLGFVSDLRIGTHANLRFTPILAFSDRKLQYAYHDPKEDKERIIKSTMVDLPLGLKLKSDKRGNFRAYLLAGGKYSMDIVSKKKTDDSDLILRERFVKNLSNFFSYEAGIGFDLYFEYFKLSPEIKFSQSIGNVLKKNEEPNPYITPVDKLFLRNFQFSLYFE